MIAAVVALDQLTKALLVRSIGLHDYVPLVDGLLSLSHVRNHGAAFGLLSDWNLPYQSLLLSMLSLLRARRDRGLLRAPAGPARGCRGSRSRSCWAARSAT